MLKCIQYPGGRGCPRPSAGHPGPRGRPVSSGGWLPALLGRPGERLECRDRPDHLQEQAAGDLPSVQSFSPRKAHHLPDEGFRCEAVRSAGRQKALRQSKKILHNAWVEEVGDRGEDFCNLSPVTCNLRRGWF